jgi:hypothetical protein
MTLVISKNTNAALKDIGDAAFTINYDDFLSLQDAYEESLRISLHNNNIHITESSLVYEYMEAATRTKPDTNFI